MAVIVINEKKYEAEAEETVLQVLRREDIDVPYLCFHEALSPFLNRFSINPYFKEKSLFFYVIIISHIKFYTAIGYSLSVTKTAKSRSGRTAES